MKWQYLTIIITLPLLVFICYELIFEKADTDND